MHTHTAHPTRCFRLAVLGLAAFATVVLAGCSMNLTKLPDGSFSFSGAIAQPVTVKGGEK